MNYAYTIKRIGNIFHGKRNERKFIDIKMLQSQINQFDFVLNIYIISIVIVH